ncbi:two-component sensor histidine kinase [Planotetraspora thailandica]|uniref:histidine kinase n=1 Tax=Planotetraspora thailandica TaxID=487172 RepID=A0A8J3V8F5_9ACTN|nr:histidine kinase [Planotetraspora thailandica]GII56806.1 two-component sensor histidine kinase [Planotetraspora thailandica]
MASGPSWLTAPRWFAVLSAVAASAAMLWRRRTAWPAVATALICLAVTGQFLPLTVAAYSMTAHRTVGCWRPVAGGMALGYLVMSGLSHPLGHLLWVDAVRAVALVYLPAVIGGWVRGYRAMIEDQWLREERAASRERRRLAGELHDTVTHAVTVMVLNAGVIQDNEDSGEIRKLARGIEDKGVRALAEMRELLTTLRRGEVPASALGVDGIPQLVEEGIATGLRISLSLDVADRGLPRQAAHACYRIVQEGLNNVRKHAPGSMVRVACETRGEVTSVSVVNDAADEEPRPRTTLNLGESGYGLEGLRERVTLVGGRLAWNRTEEGGFALTAHIPHSGRARESMIKN